MKTRQKTRRGLLIAAFILLPVTLYYFSPALSLQGAASGVASGSVLVFAGLLVSALLVGRLFCGWACPMGGLQELTFRLRGRAVRRKRIRWIKYLVWGPWLLLLAFLVLRAGGYRRAEFPYMTWHGVSVADLQGLITLLVVAGIFFILALGIGRRAGCHVLCWIAPFMVLGRSLRNLAAWPALRLKAERERCTQCRSCAQACPMSIEVTDLVQAGRLETQDCILCGTCVDTCPKGVIRYSFSKGKL
jgi:ferredoxin-type protein NapH